MRLLTGLLISLFLMAFADASLAAKAHKAPKKMTEHSIQVKFETTQGNFIVQLDKAKAPASVANFLTYVKEGFYDGTIKIPNKPRFLEAGLR